MKVFKDSILNFKCTGCGVGIYNATISYDEKCPECGYKLVTVTQLEGNKNES